MEIEELLLRRYGKFTDHRITFRPGVNIIYGGNESGKTTIHSFIRAMFFGLNRQKGRASRKDEYQVRQPWDSPGAFLGSMRIREGREVYRIDRCFDRSAQPLTLVCETQAREYANPEQELDRLLGGVSEAAFVNTVFLSQACAETDEAFAQELQKYMVNCGSSMDGDIDVSRSLQILRKKKKQLEQQKKKEEEQLEQQIEDCQRKAEILRGELDLLYRQAGQYRGAGSAWGAEQSGADGYGAGVGWHHGAGSAWGSEQSGADGYGGRAGHYPEAEPSGTAGSRRNLAHDDGGDSSGGNKVSPILLAVVSILLLTAAVLSAAGAVFLQEKVTWIILGICAALTVGLFAALRLIFRKKADESEAGGLRKEQGADIPPELMEEIEMREAARRKLQDELEQLYQQHVRPEGTELDVEISAVTLAIDRICELSDRIFQTNGGKLTETASEILSGITMGRYTRIVIDDVGEIRIHTPSRVLGLHQVSMGTMQQIYFALRMAAGELLSGDTRLPLVLDEPFAMYDDKRTEAALRWLKGCGRQVILFTCQGRERAILKRLELG